MLQSAALLWADLSRKKELERHGKRKQTDVKEEAVRQRWTDFLFQLLQENSDSFQAPPQKKVGSCLILRNELSEETHGLTKQETLLRRDARVENSRARKPRRTALPCGLQS